MAAEWVILCGWGTLGGLCLLILPRLLLCIIGFTCCGVRQSSYASDWQSGLGDVQSGSGFSCLQSCGAGGSSCGVKLGLFLFGFLVTVIVIISVQLGYAPIEPDTANSTVTAAF